MSKPPGRDELIERVRALPERLERAVAGLSAEQLTTHYLAGEWTVAQNVHHLADSHMNAYIRSRLILTEENPTLKPYDQDRWAELPDARQADLTTSLALLRAIHARWVSFWEALDEGAWERVGYHPADGVVTLGGILRSYADHGEAHLDQIGRTLAAKPSGRSEGR